MAENDFRKRAKRKLLRVTFPSGKVICYNTVNATFIGTLCEIGSSLFSEIKLELGHLPLLSTEIHPKYRDAMKLVCDGWYVNLQSNTDQKYLQLRSISDSLGLGLKIELGDDFEVQEAPVAKQTRKPKSKDNLLVKMPNGEYIANQSPIETFTQVVWEIGVDKVMRKGLAYCGNPLITTRQDSNYQVQIGPDHWIRIPNSTKDKAKMLRVIALHMHMDIEITII